MNIHSDYRAHRYLDIFLVEGQINVSVIYPGITCAFHRHKKQRDYWIVVKGCLEVKLVDIKNKVYTYILKNGLVYSSDVPNFEKTLLLIPENIWHGYRNIGTEEAVLIYWCSEKYNREEPDEERIKPEELGVEFSSEVK